MTKTLLLAFFVLMILKLTSVISCGWLIVCIPLFMMPVAWIIGVVVLAFMAYLATFDEDKF